MKPKTATPRRVSAASALPRLLSMKEVSRITGLCAAAVYKQIARGTFPRPLKVAARASRWRDDDLAAWIASRPKGTTASPNPRAVAP